MSLVTRAMIDSLLDTAPPLVVERVPCPEWGVDAYVYVKMLTCAAAEVQERISLETGREVYGALAKLGQMSPERAAALNLDDTMTLKQAEDIVDDPPSTRVPLIIATVCDDHGTCLFTTEDADSLSQQSPVLIKRLHDMAWKLNNTGEDAVEEAVKNFATSQRKDSGTGWPSNGVVLSESSSNC